MDKVLEVQQQVKNNASDLNDYLRDLDSWTKQMQTKDEQLIQAKKNKKKVDSPVGSSGKSDKEKINSDIKKETTPRKKPKIEPTATSLKSQLNLFTLKLSLCVVYVLVFSLVN